MNYWKTAANSELGGPRRLFIPGPTWIEPEARIAMCGDMTGHRSPEFIALYQHSQDVLQAMFGTTRPVYLAGCSSWGMMEAALRNLVRPGGRVLNCCNGAFSERWHQVALDCGYEARAIRIPWGRPVEPHILKAALEERPYDLVTIVHAETSTAVISPLGELAKTVKRYGDTLLAVDTVSSYSAAPLDMDRWGIDMMLAGTQKALALPPGMTVCAVSERALKRAVGIPGKGFYFNLIEYERQAAKGMTISTPCVPIVMGLAYRTDQIRREGLPQRYDRHSRLQQTVAQWGAGLGWQPLPPADCRAPSLNCLIPESGLDTERFAARLKQEHGFIIDSGYGELKGKCIRISNMGIVSEAELEPLFDAMERVLS